MRVVGAIFGCEAAGRGRCGDGLLECEELWGDEDIGEEDSGTIEGVDGAELNLNRRVVQLAQVCGDALVLLLGRAAEKLQCDVPGFGGGPAEPVWCGGIPSGGLEPIDLGDEVVCRGGG
jgi:hypothetical protein